MSITRVKPADGLKVRTEDGTRHFKPEGEPVALTTYIRRRIAAGDLVEIKAAARSKAAPAKTKQTTGED